jgi:hypothetical protein
MEHMSKVATVIAVLLASAIFGLGSQFRVSRATVVNAGPMPPVLSDVSIELVVKYPTKYR